MQIEGIFKYLTQLNVRVFVVFLGQGDMSIANNKLQNF